MKFGKIEVSPDWLIMKPALILVSLAIMFAPVDNLKSFFWFGVAALIYFGYNAIHEFIHAAAVWQHKGEIHKISLKMFRPFIDFTMKTPEDTLKVYAAGAYGDFIMGISIALALFAGFDASGNPGWVIIEVCWVILFYAEIILTPGSDLRMSLGTRQR
ncbi:MAG: hypothetical protein PHP63_07580 [Candidatus Marinimicrobia bacterium]|jgi:hypothetical protein|nr:hypothetical protein [Candidatus Neomarinimicrobiota bacterium]